MGSAFYLTWCKKCVNCWGSIESIPLLTTRRLMSWLNGLTLIDMLARRVERNGRDWHTQLPYVLFAYRASLQESPFFLMHGRDPRLQTELLMDQPSTRYQVDLDLATKVKLLPDSWPRLMWGKCKNGRRQPMIAKFCTNASLVMRNLYDHDIAMYAWIVSLLLNLWEAGKHGKTQNALFVKPYTPRLHSEITGKPSTSPNFGQQDLLSQARLPRVRASLQVQD